MKIDGVKLVSYFPGRVRLRLEDVKGQQQLARQVEEQISKINGVKLVEAKADTGSVLLKYERKALKNPDTVAKLLGTLESLFPARDLSPLRGWLEKM